MNSARFSLLLDKFLAVHPDIDLIFSHVDPMASVVLGRSRLRHEILPEKFPLFGSKCHQLGFGVQNAVSPGTNSRS